MSNLGECRLAYELIQGRCSDSHWWYVRQELKRSGFELNLNNIRLYAELKRHAPKGAISFDAFLEAYKKAEAYAQASTRSHKGGEILNILGKYEIQPHQTTISRWFKPIGGYRRNRAYSPEQLKEILVHAFIYKVRYSEKISHKSSGDH